MSLFLDVRPHSLISFGHTLPWPLHQGDGGGQSYIKWPSPSPLVIQTPPMLQVKVFIWRKNFLILKQIFNTERDFTWQCIFHGHLEDTSQHPFTPSPVRTKDGFAASRTCWYFTKIDTKIGVLMIHQNGDSTISSQHLKRNKARLKTPSTASKQVWHLLSFPWKLSFASWVVWRGLNLMLMAKTCFSVAVSTGKCQISQM